MTRGSHASALRDERPALLAGIVQIKTGADVVDLQALADARADDHTDTFAFATCGHYVGESRLVTEVISATDLLAFVATEHDLLPLRVRTMFELAQ